MSSLTLEPFGDAAWRVPLESPGDPRAVLEALRSVPRVVDAVVSEQHALVAFEAAAPPSPEEVEAAIARALSARAALERGRVHVVPIRYDGADLDEVARVTGTTAREVSRLHSAPTYVVATVGFMPGFAYLRGVDERLVLPRRSSPRARVPALAVGIAGPNTGIYPFSSPGGWHLLGTATGFVPFDARSGATLTLGDRVRFVAVAT